MNFKGKRKVDSDFLKIDLRKFNESKQNKGNDHVKEGCFTLTMPKTPFFERGFVIFDDVSLEKGKPLMGKNHTKKHDL